MLPQIASHTGLVDRAFFLANIVGAVLYLAGASRGWVFADEQGAIPVTGEPFVWAVFAIPLLVVFTLVNLTWGVLLLRRWRWGGGRVWVMTAALWLVVIYVDFAHHGYPTWTWLWRR